MRDSAPTFNTPEAPITIPLGDTNIACPLLKAPLAFRVFKRPLILT